MLQKPNFISPWFKEFYEQTPETERRLAAIMAELGSYVNSLLKSKDMTQKQLAEKLNVKPSVVSRLLQGGQNTTLKTLACLEAALGEDIVLTPKLAHTHPIVKRNFWENGNLGFSIQRPYKSSNQESASGGFDSFGLAA